MLLYQNTKIVHAWNKLRKLNDYNSVLILKFPFHLFLTHYKRRKRLFLSVKYS